MFFEHLNMSECVFWLNLFWSPFQQYAFYPVWTVGAVWPLISVTAHLAGRGPAVIQVGLLSQFVFLLTWLHEALEDSGERDSESEVAGKRNDARVTQASLKMVSWMTVSMLSSVTASEAPVRVENQRRESQSAQLSSVFMSSALLCRMSRKHGEVQKNIYFNLYETKLLTSW